MNWGFPKSQNAFKEDAIRSWQESRLQSSPHFTPSCLSTFHDRISDTNTTQGDSMEHNVAVAHMKPPQAMRDVYKQLQKSKVAVREDGISRSANVHSSQDKSDSRQCSREIFEKFTGVASGASAEFRHPETCDIPGKVSHPSTSFPFLRQLSRTSHLPISSPS